jgi:hypothetical protein
VWQSLADPDAYSNTNSNCDRTATAFTDAAASADTAPTRVIG